MQQVMFYKLKCVLWFMYIIIIIINCFSVHTLGNYIIVSNNMQRHDIVNI